MADRDGAVLGLDIGTSSSKAVLVGPDGQVLRSAARDHAVQRPAPGHVELSADVWWEEAVALIGELTAPGDVRIEAIGVSGMGPCVLLAAVDGTPVRPTILYGVDTRAEAQIRRITAELGEEEILRRAGCVLSSQAAGPKIAWVAEHEPEAYARASRLFMPSSHLTFRLTGEYVMDRVSASLVAPLYDPTTADWHRPWAERIAPGIELPTLRWAGERAGAVLPAVAARLPGIEAGTPVITGTLDAWSEALSVGATAPGDVMLMYGTTTFLVALTTEPRPSRTLWPTAGLAAGTHTLCGGMASSGAITGWLRELTGGADVPTLLAEAQESGPGARGLLMLPYFAGERSPMHDPSARGVLAGLTLSHTRGDLYRAALEAAAFGVRHHVEELAAAGVPVREMTVAGGGARDPLWPQIVSDVTGVPQRIPRDTVGASYGSARLAAAGVLGLDTSGWNPTVARLDPDPALGPLYEELYGQFRDLYPATLPVAHALARLQEDAGR
ncbi:FGGY family carbohydrate kinase [Brachybacterium sp. J144]|uniref:FGGY-family carbohydrate kinase n=1 Tax=Brachybacterium sp. J144 TaxID=3116487 RepID=UPI002E7A996B|nr:FGGY family carbohydrate kinase [Brachybacterium sp. J144]MEE1650562.1 FGGY family carbohydrate kinase [Brachybacterium sp. J144]